MSHRIMRALWAGAAILSSLTSRSAFAQATGTPPPAARPVADQRGQLPGGPPGQVPPMRAAMERRVQERINAVIRQRLALNDDQFAKLRDVAAHIEDDRRTLRNDELTTRFALRQELLAGERVNESRVSDLLDKLPKIERRRVDLIEQEQRELSKFLSPSQRARYFALQDELRRSMQDMQRRRMGLDGGPDSLAGPPRRGKRGMPGGPPPPA